MTPLRQRSFLLFLAGCAALLAPTWSAPARAADTDLSLRVNLAFSSSQLPTTEKAWYDRAWSHNTGCASTVLQRSQTDDLYTYGRSIGDYTSFMLWGLRATGDKKFLDRVKTVTDTMRTRLRDADDACVGGATDGYLNWRWRAYNAGSYSCTNTGGFFGSDHHQLDEGMTHGNLAMVAYAFHVNRDLDTAYASRATYWTNYLQNHWEAKWTKRAGNNRVKGWEDPIGMYKHEAHVVANIMKAAYYLWKITGDPFYKARADVMQARSAANCVPNPTVPGAYSWHHQVDNTDEWQKINYAEYTSQVFCDLYFDGYAPYASATEIQKHMKTWRDIVFANSAPGFTTNSPNVYGGGTPIAISSGGATAYARFDATGKLAQYANTFADDGYGAVSIYTIRAVTGYMLAISTRAGSPADVIAPAAIQDLRE